MSKIKVNTIAPRSGTTVTLGEAGNTIALGACASQTGFGRTGTVDWCTTVKTGPLTAVSGKGYFINTCGGAVTVTLPASPTAGDIVSLKDYKDTWATACKAVTLGRNGSKVGGSCAADPVLNTAGQSVTMVYIDGTQGWLNVQTDTTIVGSNFIQATGGTISTSGDYKIHKFTADGCFAISAVGPAGVGNKTSYVVVGGGGGGGSWGGGGGGAGGFREGKCSGDPYTDSPLDSGTALTVSATTYPITVGGGGAGPSNYPTRACGANGSPSIYSTITSTGGGKGGYQGNLSGFTGGSGGGGHDTPGPGGAGNTPPVSPAQGTDGGDGAGPGSYYFGGGGGGATAAGNNAMPGGGNDAGPGGAGATTSITASPVAYGGGGAGGNVTTGASTGGTGGGGTASPQGTTPTPGCANTGGGGAGAWSPNTSGPNTTAAGNGGSGIVIIRYKYQ